MPRWGGASKHTLLHSQDRPTAREPRAEATAGRIGGNWGPDGGGGCAGGIPWEKGSRVSPLPRAGRRDSRYSVYKPVRTASNNSENKSFAFHFHLYFWQIFPVTYNSFFFLDSLLFRFPPSFLLLSFQSGNVPPKRTLLPSPPPNLPNLVYATWQRRKERKSFFR